MTRLAPAPRKRYGTFSVVSHARGALRSTAEVLTHEFRSGTPAWAEDVVADTYALVEAFALHQIRRYFRHRYWEDESLEANYADRVEPGLKLENVASHSWHVADATLLLLGHFPWLDEQKCLSLAILHDKLEMYTGDANPVGRDGQGTKTHAFDIHARRVKDDKERQALIDYVSRLRDTAAEHQAGLLAELIEGNSDEAKFVKAVDKLQAFAFVHVKKGGNLLDSHIRFTLRYSEKACQYFPRLGSHYEFLKHLFLEGIARRRGITRAALELMLFGQLELELD